MIVTKENYKEVFNIFKDSCNSAKFVSFDCEMTGLNIDIKTEPTKYDTQEYRYYKIKQGVEKFDLIQLGLTFFIEKKRTNNENQEEQYYLERSFTFYLFKNPQNKFYNFEKNKNLFFLETLAHPQSLIFLSKNNFDFNTLISKGIPYTKLSYVDKINSFLKEEQNIIKNSNFFLSKENEINLIENIIKLAEFVLKAKIEKGQKKPSLILTFNKESTKKFFLGYNFKNIIMTDNFNIQTIKGENSVEIKITKNSDDIAFNLNYKSIEHFKNELKNNPKMIYELKYEPNNKYTSMNKTEELISLWEDEEKSKESIIEKQIEEELGFTNYIKYLSSKSIPLIGHNIYFDLMFLYDKFLSDLPSDFYTFKSSLHKYFPIIYDTKAISSSEANYENKTNLEVLYKTIQKKKYDTYVKFEQDKENGFNKELSDLHNAGYDSKITGECFVLMNKALENHYIINNSDISKTTSKKKKKPKIEENSINDSNSNNIKYGFCCLELFEKYENIFQMSLVESVHGKINLNINKQSKEDYLKNEKNLIENIFKNVFVVKIKNNLKEENNYLLNNYEIANLLKNEEFNLNVVKIDYDKFFVEFSSENNENCNDINDLINNIIKTNENENNKKNELLKIDEILSYTNFIDKLNIY